MNAGTDQAAGAATVAESSDADALNAAGIRLAKSGKLGDALKKFRAAVAADGRYAAAHYNLGVALAESGEARLALDSFRAALRQRPDYAEAHCGIGNTLAALGRHAESADAYRRALAGCANHGGALNGLGLALTALRRSQEAAVVLRQAARVRADDPAFHNNLGLALNDAGRYAEAETAFAEALRRDAGYAEAHVNLGNTYKEQGRVHEALACYDLAAWLRPDSVTARWNRALALLQAGDYERGWEEYEWRWARKGASCRRWDRPMWDGSPLAGRTIVLHAEQGLGDAIMFVRFAAQVKAAGGTVVAEYPAPLARILPTCPGVDRWIAEGQPLREYDCHAPLMSLPRLLETKLSTVPSDVPYLSADAARTAHWRQALQREMFGGLAVGIAWQGNPHHGWDAHRSVPLRAFAPLAAVPGVRLVSLQRGPGAEQLDDAAAAGLRILQPLDRSLADAEALMETAALIGALDLVVSVDTATAHLAGALAAPTWVLLSTMVDWRWMLGRDDTPWYPTLRLFRQRCRDCWDDVFDRVAAALALRAQGRPKGADAANDRSGVLHA